MFVFQALFDRGAGDLLRADDKAACCGAAIVRARKPQLG
jgi:hypothetical protein